MFLAKSPNYYGMHDTRSVQQSRAPPVVFLYIWSLGLDIYSLLSFVSSKVLVIFIYLLVFSIMLSITNKPWAELSSLLLIIVSSPSVVGKQFVTFLVDQCIVLGAGCCEKKVVGGSIYTLIGEEDTSTFSCMDKCTYSKEGEANSKYCFAIIQ